MFMLKFMLFLNMHFACMFIVTYSKSLVKFASGVPQGTVFGLIFFENLPNRVTIC